MYYLELYGLPFIVSKYFSGKINRRLSKRLDLIFILILISCISSQSSFRNKLTFSETGINHPVLNSSHVVKQEVVKKDVVDENIIPIVKPSSVVQETIIYSFLNQHPTLNRKELVALSTALYCEARGETLQGMEMVADVIRNRVNNKHFPNNYDGVVRQHKQFSCITHNRMLDNVSINNIIDIKSYNRALEVSKRVLEGTLPRMTMNALYYHTNTVMPYWARHYKYSHAILG